MSALLLSFLFFLNTQSTTSDSVLVSSEIEQVTVFKNQAQIQRTAEVDLNNGTTFVVFTGLSETLVDQSIQLKGNGAFTLLSLATRNDYTEKTTFRADIQALRDRRVEVQQQIAITNANLEVIKSEILLVNATQDIIKGNKLTPSELENLLSLYRDKLTDLLSKRISENNDLTKLNSELDELNKQIRESGVIERNSFKEIIAEVLTTSASTIEFELDYQVYSAGWEAAYDIRAEDIDSPLGISYKAKIFQNTGIDWDDVKFIINSGDPTSNSTKPELNTSYVGYYSRYRSNNQKAYSRNSKVIETNENGIIRGRIIDENGETVPGASMIIEGTNQGTTTDRDGAFQFPYLANGSYILSVSFIGYKPQRIPINIYGNGLYIEAALVYDNIGLNEMVVTGSEARLSGVISQSPIQPFKEKPIVIQSIEASNQTSFSYEIAIPYSVPSDGKFHTVEIKRESPDTEYEFSTTPKLSPNAYLVGNLPNWYDLKLIEGEANIYFDNRFVGTTFIDPASIDDTLTVSLGKDERIVINREKLRDFSSKNFFRNKVKESYVYEINIRNSKSEAVTITVEDQVPISTNEEIKVSSKDLNGGSLDKETGIITWELTLNPGETKKVRFSFDVEYPKGRRVVF